MGLMGKDRLEGLLPGRQTLYAEKQNRLIGRLGLYARARGDGPSLKGLDPIHLSGTVLWEQRGRLFPALCPLDGKRSFFGGSLSRFGGIPSLSQLSLRLREFPLQFLDFPRQIPTDSARGWWGTHTIEEGRKDLLTSLRTTPCEQHNSQTSTCH